ncbi:ABC transporter ATP-binding protein [Telmatocola sphagniphila]|jgi:ABC-2 type transport system ATP-binding protein|uniref:ABC transporter ATP-binding protein n=1 Tax=Telmatocola sphagniphila TaxID=1123043 RepID=A0A8E6EUG4_9BACT|nr:ABC transporter ATP-binding protein [Telmatocola sphagniphila]QVL33679.1 ABC transporter ATP-binding protein [Telmatocola sphagniphila]
MNELANNPKPPILHFEQVSKWYGGVIGVNHVSLELNKGITGLVGANGAGKSTLLRLATGQLRPNLGKVQIQGIDAWNWQAKQKVGYCPDNDNFYEEMSGREFVLTMARLCGFSAPLAKSRTEEVLAQVGMAERADRKLRGYSKGMRQRVKLAQALLNDPQLLVLDEPLSGIDPIGRKEMLDVFRSLAEEGKCLLISSHELEELEKLTDHVAIMARGRIAAVGTLTQIRELIDDQPLSVRIDAPNIRQLAAALLQLPEVVGLDLEPKILKSAQSQSLIVFVRHPKRFFEEFGNRVLENNWQVSRLEALDDSAHAVLGYLLGGSGKT